MPNQRNNTTRVLLVPKKFELWRSPIGGASPRERDCARRIVEARSIDQLIAAAKAFGAETSQPSRIFLRCLSKRRFVGTPWSIRCDENMRQGGRHQ
jgi:hypothetical protein